MIEGIASVDESAITGESAPVIREAGGDRSAVTGGTRVLSDRIVVEITQEPGQILPRPDDRPGRGGGAAQDAERDRARHPARRPHPGLPRRRRLAAPVRRSSPAPTLSETTLIALLVALIPTTIGALLSAIGIAGMDRLVRRNVLALSGRAVEASGDCDVLLLDKTGTITLGNREATEFMPMPGVERARSWPRRRRCPRSPTRPRRGARSSSSPRSYGIREHDFAGHEPRFVPFTRRDADERRRLQRHPPAQGRRRRDRGLGRARGRPAAGRAAGAARPDRPRGRHAAGGRPRRARARRRLPQGHRQGGDERPASTSCGRWASARSWSPATTS